MKKALIIVGIALIAQLTEAQSLTEISKEYLQPRSNTEDIREGLKQVEYLCETTPQEKCNKAMAIGYYLLADDYYKAGYQVFLVDTTMAKPVLIKAKELYNRASSYVHITDFSESYQNMMLANKNMLEANPKYKRK